MNEPANAYVSRESESESVRDAALDTDLAPDNSACPSKSNGGIIGWISRGQTVGPFEDVAFTTPVGGVAKATTSFGMHIIQVGGGVYTRPLNKPRNSAVVYECLPLQRLPAAGTSTSIYWGCT
jgi:hypothetical protein